MPKFKKDIVTEGLYLVGDGKGGRKVEFISADRIKHWNTQFHKMREAGLTITAPAIHKQEAKPENPNDPQAWSKSEEGKKLNYGFWESTDVVDTVDDQGQPVKALKGIVDVPRDEDASHVGTTVRATSIFAQPEFVDGKGNVWKDVLTHIYVGNDAIEPGQKNFEPVSDEAGLSIAMSHRLPIQMDHEIMNSLMDSDSNVNSDDLFDLLETVAGICLSRETRPDELMKALLAALKQKQLSESNRKGGTESTPPDNSVLNEVPVVMATANQTSQSTAGTPAPVTPVQSSTPSPETISMSQFEEVKSTNATLMNMMVGQKKQELANRVGALFSRGIINAEQKEAYLTQVNGIVSMSLGENNQPAKSQVEIALEALEAVKIALPANQGQVAMAQQDEQGNMVIQPNPTPLVEGVMDDQRADEIVNGLFGGTSAAS